MRHATGSRLGGVCSRHRFVTPSPYIPFLWPAVSVVGLEGSGPWLRAATRGDEHHPVRCRFMCRNGLETAGTVPRRCECTDSQRAAHNATRTMTRTAAELRNCDDPGRVETLRERFVSYLHRFRAAVGMGDGEFPVVPDQVSQVGRYSPESMDALPFEVLDERMTQAFEDGDYIAAEVLAAEMDKRSELGGEHPEAMGQAEEQRWETLRRDGLPEGLGTLDPVTHPMARQPQTTAKDREKVMRAEYESWLELEMLRAEEDTRGTLLTSGGRSKALSNPNITTRALWTNHIIATNYASEELKRYWSEPGNERLSYAAFVERWSGSMGAANERVTKSSLLNF